MSQVNETAAKPTKLQVALNPKFISELFVRVGGYRKNDYNMAAITLIQRGAGLGLGVVDKLPAFVGTLFASGNAEYASRGATDGLQTLKTVADTLLSSAVRSLYSQLKAEEQAVENRVNAPRYTLTGAKADALPAITADAWATEEVTTEQAATAEQLALGGSVDGDHVAREMLDEEEWEEKRLTTSDIREQIEALAELFNKPVLLADQILNSWRPDYADRPHISYTRVAMSDGNYKDAATIDEAITMLRLMEDERVIQRRDNARRTVAAAAQAWV